MISPANVRCDKGIAPSNKSSWGHPMKSNKQINIFEQRFSEEVIDIMAVTGPSGVGAGKAGKETLWTASIPLIAWKEKDRIITEKVRLCWLTDEKGLRENKRNYIKNLSSHFKYVKVKVNLCSFHLLIQILKIKNFKKY